MLSPTVILFRILKYDRNGVGEERRFFFLAAKSGNRSFAGLPVLPCARFRDDGDA
ncbi:hypothetical protein LH462_08275 [Laribacter hongkongensis]|uniref:Uncharacterized protein n=1 Tax=Laribacter hongkongensis TaxID=168471 RepID=A0ABD4SRT1_9NEIS|nr:hypothetical protein [Laribacter hongkongensis]MCG9025712.1 hypothetical protein [Laribacter hongkongensis]MCG9040198.1 hypothetical protein [Laribacter hongkongensis]MCG9053831.1 hypothetical protein [Laribacter hongkongensis]MCG9067662.1 hypothetical protein [Laribacter hongkongensis]MCG9078585.1 hypothetical protein [Laribacter hongkongensis]